MGDREVTEDLLDDLVARGEELLADSFEELHAAYERGRRSHTPPRTVHRLVAQIDAARRSADSYRSGEPSLRVLDVLELSAALELFERWRAAPAWDAIVGALANPDDYPHAVITLAVASHLTDAGNRVELLPAHGDVRTPDIAVRSTTGARTNVEVKTPRALQQPHDRLSQSRAEKIIGAAVKDAGMKEGGQLSPTDPGILVVGGFYLADADLDALEEAATRRVRDRESRSHIAAVAIVAFGAFVEDKPGGGDTRWHGTISVRVAENPSYVGDVHVDATERGSNLIKDATEITSEQLLSARAKARLGRNAPCWCGSGKKFKKCHGR